MPSAASQSRLTGKLLPALQRLLVGQATFTELTIGHLMAEAGMSRRTFYVYFEDKAAFIREVAGLALDDALTSCESLWSLPGGASKAEVRAAICEMADGYAPHRSLMRAVSETATYDAGVREAYLDRLTYASDRMEKQILEGQRAGDMDAGIDAATTAVWLSTMLAAGFADLDAMADPETRAAHLDAVANIVWQTMFRGPE